MAEKAVVVLRIQSRDGMKRIECGASDSLNELFKVVSTVHQIQDDGEWKLYKDRNKKQQLTPRALTVSQAGLRHGDMLYLDHSLPLPLETMDTRTDEVRSNSLVPGMPRSLGSLPSLGGMTPNRDFASSDAVAGSSPVAEGYAAIPPAVAARFRTRNESTSSFASQHETHTTAYSTEASSTAQEDEVDILLEKQDGRIERPRDERRCRHSPHGRCLYCTPIEPFDEEYLKSRTPPIKHMSFHSYIRKLQSGVDKGKFIALKEPSFRIKPGCTDHQPWPEGICTRCQPRPVTLNRQIYRHVDNIMFENAQMVDGFLEYWRQTGEQRIGFLYGTYERHKDVPLGIRARIVAIYEPPQTSTVNAVELGEDIYVDAVEALASRLGIRRVGWIFTDLESLDPRAGTVKHLRGKDTYFLTAEECLQAGYFQCRNPNACRLSPDGAFGSKFVTVVCTGDASSSIHLEGYQVSNQCSALVRDMCVVPTIDSPELAYVRESTTQQYVPDVLFKEEDAYNNSITKVARPFPVEYLIVDVPASSAKVQQYTFELQGKVVYKRFPVENREPSGAALSRQITLSDVKKYLSQFSTADRPIAFRDFHFLLYLTVFGQSSLPVPLSDDELGILCEALKSDESFVPDMARFLDSSFVRQLQAAVDIAMPDAANGGERGGVDGRQLSGRTGSGVASGGGVEWACPHCTFLNRADCRVCEMCSLPPTS